MGEFSKAKAIFTGKLAMDVVDFLCTQLTGKEATKRGIEGGRLFGRGWGPPPLFSVVHKG